MKERPVLMQTENVKAILDGRKTQTRRMIKPQPFTDKIFRNINTKFRNKTQPCVGWNKGKDGMVFGDWAGFTKNATKCCPYGQVGDRLWVRETHYRWGEWIKNGFTKTGKQKWTFKALSKEVRYIDNRPTNVYSSGCKEHVGWFKRPSIFMPRWASRITLEITGVRVERLQEISMADRHCELGISLLSPMGAIQIINKWISLWDSLNAKRGYGWETNLWVWVLEFKKVDK